MGRKRVQIKKLDGKDRYTTFSKRRVGLLNKASELSLSCGAEIAVIFFSPDGRRTFAFGHPSPDAVIDRYLGRSLCAEPPAIDSPKASESYKSYEEAAAELEKEKQKGKRIEQLEGERNNKFLWEEPIDDMELEELEQYMASVKEMRERVIEILSQKEMGRASSPLSLSLAINTAADHLITRTTDCNTSH